MTEYIHFGGKYLRQFIWKQCEHLHRAIKLVWRCTPPGVHSEFLPSSSQFQNVIFLIHTHKGLITEVQQSTLLLLCICSTGNYKWGFWVLKASLFHFLTACTLQQRMSPRARLFEVCICSYFLRSCQTSIDSAVHIDHILGDFESQ